MRSALAQAQWRQAVLTELAEPGYIDLAPLRNEESKIFDFSPTQVSPTAAKLLGLDGEPVSAQLLGDIGCVQSRRHLLEGCRQVAIGGRDVALTAKCADGTLDSVVVHRVFASQTSVTVGLTCPTAIARLRTAERALHALDPLASPVANSEAVRVLVVDDNVDAATTMCELLEFLGFETAAAFSGPECLAVAARFDPRLAFVDFDMPGMDGCEAVRQLRLQESEVRPTFICLTGRSGAENQQMCRAAGFDELVTKPMSFDHLTKTIADIAR